MTDLVSPDLLTVLFLGSILDQSYTFSDIPEPETKNRLPTCGQYQNIWSIDSVSSQQHLQHFDDLYTPNIKHLLCNWESREWKHPKIIKGKQLIWLLFWCLWPSYLMLSVLNVLSCDQLGTSKISSQLFCNLHGTAVSLLVLKWNWYMFLFITLFFTHLFFNTGPTYKFLNFSPFYLPLPFLW